MTNYIETQMPNLINAMHQLHKNTISYNNFKYH